MLHFEVGKTYVGRSLTDYDCRISVHVLSRTPKTLTATVNRDPAKLFRVKVSAYPGAPTYEYIYPWGSGYSMCPIVGADDVVT